MSLSTDNQPVEGRVPSAPAPKKQPSPEFQLFATFIGMLRFRSKTGQAPSGKYWYRATIGAILYLVMLPVLAISIAAYVIPAGSTSTTPQSLPTVQASQPAVPATAKADLVAEYADNYPSSIEERFAVVDSLPTKAMGGIILKASLTDNGGRAAAYIVQYWMAAYVYHDPRYLWAIVNDPAASPLYQKLKNLPPQYNLGNAYGDPNLESLPGDPNLPLRNVGLWTFNYLNGPTETASDWVLRWNNDHWIVSIGNDGH